MASFSNTERSVGMSGGATIRRSLPALNLAPFAPCLQLCVHCPTYSLSQALSCLSLQSSLSRLHGLPPVGAAWLQAACALMMVGFPFHLQAFQRWKDGKKGLPLVDANMRELKQTGESLLSTDLYGTC